MADRYAVATGNWSDPTIWDGGTLPTNGDNVYANGYTVTIDMDLTGTSAPAMITNDEHPNTGVGGGKFIVNTTRQIGDSLNLVTIQGGKNGTQQPWDACVEFNAPSGSSLTIYGDVIGGNYRGWYGLIARGTAGNSVSITVNGNVKGGQVVTSTDYHCHGIVVTDGITCDILVTGQVSGGLGRDCRGINCGSGTTVNLTVQNGIYGGSHTNTFGVYYDKADGSLTVQNGVYAGSGSSSYGIYTRDATHTVNITVESGGVHGGSADNAVGINQVSQGTLSITGLVEGGHIPSGNSGDYNDGIHYSGGSTLTINGDVRNGIRYRAYGLRVWGGPDVTINGNVYTQQNSSGHAVRLETTNGGANLTVNGNVTADSDYAITSAGGQGTIIINGNVAGGNNDYCRGLDVGATSVQINGNVTSGPGYDAFGIRVFGSTNLQIGDPANRRVIDTAGRWTVHLDGDSIATVYGDIPNGLGFRLYGNSQLFLYGNVDAIKGSGVQLSYNSYARIEGYVKGGPSGDYRKGVAFGTSNGLEVIGDVYAGRGYDSYGIDVTGSGTVIVTGRLYQNRNRNAIRLRGSATVIINGDIVPNLDRYERNRSIHVEYYQCKLVINGNVYAGNLAQTIWWDGHPDAVMEINGDVIADPAYTADQVAIETGEVNEDGYYRTRENRGIIKVNGNLVYNYDPTSPYYGMPLIRARFVMWNGANHYTAYPEWDDAAGTIKSTPVYHSGGSVPSAGTWPQPADVRDGIVFGPTNEYTGSLKVPLPEQVAFGIPVDNTTGQAVLRPEDVWNHAVRTLTQAGNDAVADTVLKRSVINVESQADVYSLATVILALLSMERSNGNLTIYRSDGSTVHVVRSISVDPALQPVRSVK